MPETSCKFGEFELDIASFELRRRGRTVKLERIPMELLILLAEREGNLVTRQEITGRLWGEDVNVDTVHGINTAIRKIRKALRDDPEQPRFLQTVTGKGYRFIASRDDQSHNGATAVSPRPETAQQNRSITPHSNAANISADLSSRRHVWYLISAAALIFVFAAVALLALNPVGIRDRLIGIFVESRIRSIAVLPLANLSGDPSQDYFADGVTDELITALAKNRSLRVISRTTVMQYRGVHRPVRDIARELGVDGILEGSVERSSSRVHLNVQLVYAPTDTHLWAETYDRDLKDAIALPSELSQTVAKEIKIATSPTVPVREIRPEAHDAYLLGRYLWFSENYQRSQEYFEKAIQLQPDYAAAWGGFADANTVMAVAGRIPPKNVISKAENAARKALELDPSIAEVHNSAAGVCFFLKWDWSCAEKELERAIELGPNLAEPHHLRCYVMIALNRPDDAIREQQRAMELDPFQRPWALGYAYMMTRHYDAALNELKVRSEARSDNVSMRYQLAEAYLLNGMQKESVEELRQALLLSGDKKSADALAQTFAEGGFAAIAKEDVQEARERANKGYLSPLQLAHVYARAGDKDQTLRWLDEAYRERSPRIVFLQAEPDFEFLHSDEHFREIATRIGLPPMH